VPFKFHSKGRRHIARQRHRVTNWRDYDAALRNRGSLTIWFTEEALAGWKAQPRTTRGGQPHYSDLAIETALTLRAVFRLALRQSEGLIGSIMRMLEIDLPVPEHTTLSRRACGLPVQTHRRTETGDHHLIVDSTGLKLRGAGEWLFEKHGAAKRRAWRKLHLGIDVDSGAIVACNLTDKDVDDASHVEPLLDQLRAKASSLVRARRVAWLCVLAIRVVLGARAGAWRSGILLSAPCFGSAGVEGAPEIEVGDFELVLV
jgi:hypothetical protein